MPPKRVDAGVTHGSSDFPTHFLALPLVNADSLPQLARSVAEFQAATTKAPALRPSEIRRLELQAGEEYGNSAKGAKRGSDGGDTMGDGKGESWPGRLQILPQKAQRPAGTLHLTLGTMVLKDAQSCRRALEVLRQIDYVDLLREVRSKARSRRTLEPAADNNADLQSDAAKSQELTHDQADDEVETGGGLMEAGEEVAASLRTLNRPVSPPSRMNPSVGSRPSPTSVEVSLRGLGTFPSPKKARVFYAIPYSRPEDEGTLQAFAEAVQKRFIDAGVVRNEGRALTLHATVANLKYAKAFGRNGRGHGGQKPSAEVDARELLETYGEKNREGGFLWARNVTIDRVRICKMGAIPSEDPVKGLEYPAVKLMAEDGEEELAEVVLS
jgi:hypothetical protein